MVRVVLTHHYFLSLLVLVNRHAADRTLIFFLTWSRDRLFKLFFLRFWLLDGNIDWLLGYILLLGDTLSMTLGTDVIVAHSAPKETGGLSKSCLADIAPIASNWSFKGYCRVIFRTFGHCSRVAS
jgi:hypothetical protein